VQYGTIINANVRRLNVSPIAVRGDPLNPVAVVVSATVRASAGTILTAKPSAKLPAGLFHRILSTRRSGRRLTLKLAPAHLTQAFPELDLNSKIALSPAKATVSQAASAEFDPLVASLGIGNFSCQLPLADSQFTASQSFGIGADVQIHIPTFFGIPDGLPDGKIALTMSASASLEALIRKNVGCSANVKLPPLPGAIPVGPVVVPVYAQVSLAGSATIGADLQAQASAGFSLTAGMEFQGTSVHNISSASANASASASGAGELSVGPVIRFAVGVADVADLHLDAQPSLAFSAALDGSCSLNLVSGSEVGISLGPIELNQSLPAPTRRLYSCPQPPKLSITQSAPFGAFPNQAFEYVLKVTNNGAATAHEVDMLDTLPAEGSFVASVPNGNIAAPTPGSAYTVALGDLPAGQSKSVAVHWRAPGAATNLVNSAFVKASNAAQSASSSATVPVGTTGNCNPCGAAAAGTGLRNRAHGSIAISGIPPGATVGRAVLIWGILYDGSLPPNTITFDGHPVTADVTSNVSGTLCWGDTATVGYAADVTGYVTGNGTFEVTEPPNGEVRVDESPYGTLPYTDGATLVVFYNGGGADNQVLSDFSYNTNTDTTTGESITRTFSNINSVGGASSLTLAGPDGQNNGGKIFEFFGADEQTVIDPFVGSAPQDGPSFPIGNLWDTESFDVGALLPTGQQTFTFNTSHTEDCVGVGAAVLQVAQGG
jgi:uncharacterized repeat protein (TIGR01451 family)